jgi:hypothetical protein
MWSEPLEPAEARAFRRTRPRDDFLVRDVRPQFEHLSPPAAGTDCRKLATDVKAMEAGDEVSVT